MKKLVLLVMTLTMVATSGCLYGRRITVNHQGMEAINQSQKETQAVLDECQNQVQAASQAIADNPRANVKTCGLEYQGTPPEALKVQQGVIRNRDSNNSAFVRISGHSLSQPTTGNQESIVTTGTIPPLGKLVVRLYPGQYAVSVTVNNQTGIGELLVVDTIAGNYLDQRDNVYYDWGYQVP